MYLLRNNNILLRIFAVTDTYIIHTLYMLYITPLLVFYLPHTDSVSEALYSVLSDIK